MNNTLELLYNHTSIRSYTDQPLTKEQRDTIFNAASQTSTASLLQVVSLFALLIQAFEKKL